MWEVTLVCDCSRFSSQQVFSWCSCWCLTLSQLPPFPTSFLWPNRYSTDYICSFNWFSNGFQHWFVGSFNRLSTGGFQQVVLAVFQQVFNWLSNRFSTSCDCLAVEFSRGDGNCRHDQGGGERQGAIIKKSRCYPWKSSRRYPWQSSMHARLWPRSQPAGSWWWNWGGTARRTFCSPTAN